MGSGFLCLYKQGIGFVAGCLRRLGRDRHGTILCGRNPSLIVTKTNSKGAHMLACGVTCLLRQKCAP